MKIILVLPSSLCKRSAQRTSGGAVTQETEASFAPKVFLEQPVSSGKAPPISAVSRRPSTSSAAPIAPPSLCKHRDWTLHSGRPGETGEQAE